MFPQIQYLGLQSNLLAIIVSLILVPSMYIYFAVDVHKDYSELTKTVIFNDQHTTSAEKAALLQDINEKLSIFELDWWVVAAFGVLMMAIIASSNIGSLSKNLTQSPGAPNYHCSVDIAVGAPGTTKEAEGAARVSNWMSFYATAVGLLIGFRLAWARLRLARDMRRIYELRYLVRSRRARRTT